jgi:hypothetical protein
MNINLNQSQARNAGIFLIVVGVVAIFNLWWLVPAVALGGAGIFAYRRSRALGRTGEAVQAALWGLGLAVLYLIGAIFPGILLLAGASLLLRGREQAADVRAQRVIGRMTSRRHTANAPSQPTSVTIVTNDQPNTSDTIRLR